MRALIQRVKRARVLVDEQCVGRIDHGLCVFVGVLRDDETKDAKALARKVASLRIFSDADEKMNLSVRDVGGAALAVSQFTLCADTRKGTRPSFVQAMAPGPAKELFEFFVEALRSEAVDVATGTFQAEMLVEIENSGPVTILLDTKRES